MKSNLFETSYTVKFLEQKTAKSFIITHHYSGSYPAACVNLGAYVLSRRLEAPVPCSLFYPKSVA